MGFGSQVKSNSQQQRNTVSRDTTQGPSQAGGIKPGAKTPFSQVTVSQNQKNYPQPPLPNLQRSLLDKPSRVPNAGKISAGKGTLIGACTGFVGIVGGGILAATLSGATMGTVAGALAGGLGAPVGFVIGGLIGFVAAGASALLGGAIGRKLSGHGQHKHFTAAIRTIESTSGPLNEAQTDNLNSLSKQDYKDILGIRKNEINNQAQRQAVRCALVRHIAQHGAKGVAQLRAKLIQDFKNGKTIPKSGLCPRLTHPSRTKAWDKREGIRESVIALSKSAPDLALVKSAFQQMDELRTEIKADVTLKNQDKERLLKQLDQDQREILGNVRGAATREALNSLKSIRNSLDEPLESIDFQQVRKQIEKLGASIGKNELLQPGDKKELGLKLQALADTARQRESARNFKEIKQRITSLERKIPQCLEPKHFQHLHREVEQLKLRLKDTKALSDEHRSQLRSALRKAEAELQHTEVEMKSLGSQIKTLREVVEENKSLRDDASSFSELCQYMAYDLKQIDKCAAKIHGSKHLSDQQKAALTDQLQWMKDPKDAGDGLLRLKQQGFLTPRLMERLADPYRPLASSMDAANAVLPEIAKGNTGYIDNFLFGDAQWDDVSLEMKLKLNPSTLSEKEKTRIAVQHQLFIAKRELAEALRVDSALSKVGGKSPRFLNSFQNIVFNKAFLNLMKNVKGLNADELNLRIAEVVILEQKLKDPNLDSKQARESIKQSLEALGITDQMDKVEHWISQGLNSVNDVKRIGDQISKFASALQKNDLVGDALLNTISNDPKVMALSLSDKMTRELLSIRSTGALRLDDKLMASRMKKRLENQDEAGNSAELRAVNSELIKNEEQINRLKKERLVLASKLKLAGSKVEKQGWPSLKSNQRNAYMGLWKRGGDSSIPLAKAILEIDRQIQNNELSGGSLKQALHDRNYLLGKLANFYPFQGRRSSSGPKDFNDNVGLYPLGLLKAQDALDLQSGDRDQVLLPENSKPQARKVAITRKDLQSIQLGQLNTDAQRLDFLRAMAPSIDAFADVLELESRINEIDSQLGTLDKAQTELEKTHKQLLGKENQKTIDLCVKMAVLQHFNESGADINDYEINEATEKFVRTKLKAWGMPPEQYKQGIDLSLDKIGKKDFGEEVLKQWDKDLKDSKENKKIDKKVAKLLKDNEKLRKALHELKVEHKLSQFAGGLKVGQAINVSFGDRLVLESGEIPVTAGVAASVSVALAKENSIRMERREDGIYVTLKGGNKATVDAGVDGMLDLISAGAGVDGSHMRGVVFKFKPDDMKGAENFMQSMLKGDSDNIDWTGAEDIQFVKDNEVTLRVEASIGNGINVGQMALDASQLDVDVEVPEKASFTLEASASAGVTLSSGRSENSGKLTTWNERLINAEMNVDVGLIVANKDYGVTRQLKQRTEIVSQRGVVLPDTCMQMEVMATGNPENSLKFLMGPGVPEDTRAKAMELLDKFDVDPEDTLAVTYKIKPEAARHANQLNALALRLETAPQPVGVPQWLGRDDYKKAKQLHAAKNWRGLASLYRKAAKGILKSSDSYQAAEFSYIPATRSNQDEEKLKSIPVFTTRTRYAQGDLELPAYSIDLGKDQQ